MIVRLEVSLIVAQTVELVKSGPRNFFKKSSTVKKVLDRLKVKTSRSKKHFVNTVVFVS